MTTDDEVAGGAGVRGRPNAPLPYSLVRSSKPGDLFSPDRGRHKGHVVELVSLDALRFNIVGEPLRSALVRCHDDNQSWTFAHEGDRG